MGALIFLLFYVSLPGSLIGLVALFEWLHWNELLAGAVWLITLVYLHQRYPDFGSGD
jgi:putative effector of murein hydrolase LrgA (UPF0299 family)